MRLDEPAQMLVTTDYDHKAIIENSAYDTFMIYRTSTYWECLIIAHQLDD